MTPDDTRRENVDKRIARLTENNIRIEPMSIFIEVLCARLFPGEEGREEFNGLVLDQWETTLDDVEAQLRAQGVNLAPNGLHVPPMSQGGLVIPSQN